MTIARTSRSASSLANTSGISAQNAGPIALPLPGPTSVTCATWPSTSTVTDSYASPMGGKASHSRRRAAQHHLFDDGARQETAPGGRHDARDHLGLGRLLLALVLFEDRLDHSALCRLVELAVLVAFH